MTTRKDLPPVEQAEVLELYAEFYAAIEAAGKALEKHGMRSEEFISADKKVDELQKKIARFEGRPA